MSTSQGWNLDSKDKTYPAWDTKGDGKLSPAEAAAVEYINVTKDFFDDDDHKIASLGGLEHFTGLKILSCDYNNITSFDVSENTALTYLNCAGAGISTLNIGSKPAMINLYCQDNELTALDISGCSVMTLMNCHINQLTSLDLSKCLKLDYLQCNNNHLSSLSVPENSELYIIDCFYNRMAKFDASKMKLNNGDYYDLCCGRQKTADGKENRDLILTLRDDQKLIWDANLKDDISNKRVLIAGMISEIGTSSTLDAGSISIFPYKAAPGSIVTVAAYPNEGYKFSEWKVISGNITFEESTNQDTRFIMPLTDGVIFAEFVAK